MDSITTILPCDESDFAFGIISTERAALPGTRAAMANPSLTSVKPQSLFASVSVLEAIFIVLLSLKHSLQDPEIGEHILYVYLPPSPCKTTVLTLLELIRTHNLWGSVARRACRNGAGLAGPESEPWKADSEYERLTLSSAMESGATEETHMVRAEFTWL